MVDAASGAIVDESDLTRSAKAILQALGMPSLAEYDQIKPLAVWNGRHRAGLSTDGFAQAAYISEATGGHVMGDGVDSDEVAVVNADWAGTGGGTPRVLTKTGAFARWAFYTGAYITLDSAHGGFGAGEIYEIEAKVSDDAIRLKSQDSVDGTPLPAGSSAGTVDFTVSTQSWAEMYTILAAPVDATNQNFPAPTGSPPQSKYWNYTTFSLPPGAFTNGAKIVGELLCRIKMTEIATRPDAKCLLWVTLDPITNANIQDNRQNSGAVGRVRATRLGFSPGSHGEVSSQYTAATISNVNGKVLVTLARHSQSTGTIINVTDIGDGAGIDDLVSGQGYYVCSDASIDPDIADVDNTFTLSYSDPNLFYNPVAYTVVGGASSLVLSRRSFGSYRRVAFPFAFTASEQTTNDDYEWARIYIIAHADGQTTQTESGAVWIAGVRIEPYAEEFAHGASTNFKDIAMSANNRDVSAALSRTTPGNAMNVAGSGTESAIGAPLFRIKNNAYTDGAAASFHAYASTMMDYGGGWDVVHIDKKLHNEAMLAAGGVTFTAASWDPTTRVIQKAGAFTAYSFTDGDRVRIVSGTGWTAGYYLIEKKLANNQLKLIAGQAGMPASSNTDTVGDVDEYPLIAFLGEDATGQVQNNFFRTRVRRGDGTDLGDVYFHDNINREIWVRRGIDGEYVIPGETLTLDTFRREKLNGSGAWGFHDSTPIRSYTVVAGRVDRGPQSIPMQMRLAISGPQNGDCEVDVRCGTFFVATKESR